MIVDKRLYSEAAGDSMETLLARYRTANDLRSLMACWRTFLSIAPLADDKRPTIRLALTGNYSTQFIGKGLPLAMAARGVCAAIYESDYNAWQIDLRNTNSAFYGFAPSHVLLALSSTDLAYGALRVPDKVAHAVAAAAASVLANSQAHLFVTLPEPLPEEVSDQCAIYSWRQRTRALLREQLNDPRITLIDMDPLVIRAGLAAWHDERFYLSAKLPFHPDRVACVLSHLSAAIAGTAISGVKLVVCDLDDTMWAGRVGDDGFDGVGLDVADGGRHHLRLQLFLKGLAEQGILLAIASKNEVKPVQDVFARRPEMLLALDDFVATQIHWEPKSLSIKRILTSLNLTSAGVVFLDDNPVERAEVARAFPELLVPDLPEDVAAWVPMLVETGWFDRRIVSEESRQRRQMYQENAAREAGMGAAHDIEAFLVDLDMVMQCYPAEVHRNRVLELIQKTNQFNTTTRRYNWAEVEAVTAGGLALCFRLRDRFGDNGITSVVLLKPEQHGDYSIDLWLMSCRVMGRQFEHAIMNDLLARLALRGAKGVIGRYAATTKNAPVANLYQRLGFVPAAASEGFSNYYLAINGAVPAPLSSHIRSEAAGEGV